MFHFQRAFIVLIGLGLTACGADTTFVRTEPAPVTDRIQIAYRSIEVRRVTLPTYAASEEIYGQGADGILASTGSVRWADVPDRAITLELSRNLAELTGARTASEPWPFTSQPDAHIEVRFEDLLAGADGVFRVSGQYFMTAETGRERSGFFNIQIAYDPAGGPEAIARARSAAVLELAKTIAQKTLR
jgi:uncharacterized lipoprotein YmbA